MSPAKHGPDRTERTKSVAKSPPARRGADLARSRTETRAPAEDGRRSPPVLLIEHRGFLLMTSLRVAADTTSPRSRELLTARTRAYAYTFDRKAHQGCDLCHASCNRKIGRSKTYL